MNDKLLIKIVGDLSSIEDKINSPWSIVASIAAMFTAMAACFTVYQTRELEKDRELPIVIPSGSNNISGEDDEFSFPGGY